MRVVGRGVAKQLSPFRAVDHKPQGDDTAMASNLAMEWWADRAVRTVIPSYCEVSCPRASQGRRAPCQLPKRKFSAGKDIA